MQTSVNAKASKVEVDSQSQRIDGVEYNVFTKADNFSVGPPLLWDPAYGHQITADCYTKAQVNAFLDAKPDDADPDLKADKEFTYTKTEVTDKIVAVVGAAPALRNTLVELSAALNNDANYATTITNALATKAPLASPTFTGTVGGLTKTTVNLANVDNTTDLLKPLSIATIAALVLKADASSLTNLVLG